MGPNDILRLSHCPSLPLDSNDSNLYGCFSGSIYDPCLTSVSRADEFGERILSLWDVNQCTVKNTNLGLSQTNVGKAYSSLFPNDLQFTKSYELQEAIVNTFQMGMEVSSQTYQMSL
eukprot:15353499-Ditylum_brightwellii.AAC.1